MKVLFISSLYPPNLIGGAERVVHRLATALAKKGHEPVVITTQPDGPERTGEVDGARVYYLPVRNLYRPFSGVKPGLAARAMWHLLDSYNPLMGRRVGEIVRRERPAVINSHNINGFSVAAWSAASALRTPLVHTLHELYLLCAGATMFKHGSNCSAQCAACRVYAVPRRRATGLVNTVIGVSDFILRRHLEYGYFPSAEHRVIYNAVAGAAPEAPVERFATGPMKIGFIGQIKPDKGLHLLIDAFLKLPASAAELLIAGRGGEDYCAELVRRTSGRPEVRWLGYVRPDQFYRDIDLLVAPSLWNDSAPLVVQEALSSGVPVLGSNRGGIPELVKLGTGWIFDPDRPGDLEAQLRLRLQERSGPLPPVKIYRGGDESQFADAYLDAYESARLRAGT